MEGSSADGALLGGKRAKVLLRVLVSAGVLYILFRQLDWQQASKILTSANLSWLIPPVVVMVIDRCWMAWKWRMLLAVLGPVPSLYDSIRVYYVSSFQGIAIPLGGLGPDIVRYAHLRSSDLSRHLVATSIVMERAIGILATGILAVLGGGILVQKVGVLGGANVLNAILLMGGGGSVVLGGLLFSSRIQKTVYRLLTRSRALAKSDTFERFAEALREYRDVPGIILLNLVLALIEQLFSVLVFFLGAVAFQVSVTFMDCLAAVPISTLLERLPVSYAGLGVREGALVFLFGVLGVDYSEVLILSSVMFVLYLSTLIPGLLWSFDRTEYATTKGRGGIPGE
ncbi:uncharacterized protein (TIRG00374 family) [Salinibacter ruber]|uniref:lysylphosphatidylglycerol synthase transmembrane domain-containing protein n=1 Tax=Salinibacter ruber TaxID=146919 RepID=UPI002168A398|nr:lysylphosphatidylglycerol synthase transmembrane domain-containing protein [Salinibacter ruber]MCS3700163.1 uncharacterized protein (TIRG00374 family) [Salinibacter ruber]